MGTSPQPEWTTGTRFAWSGYMFRINQKAASAAVVALLGLTLLSGSGCSTLLNGGRLKTNRAQHMVVAAGAPTLFAAVLSQVESQGWQVEEADRTAGRVVALTPFEVGDGLVTRERWIFTATDHDLAVQKYLEAAEADDPADVLDWESYDVVCASYGYASERAELAGIAERARASMALNR